MHFQFDDEVSGSRCVHDQSDMFATLGRQAQREPMGSDSAVPAMRTYWAGDSAQMWLSASIVAVAVVGGLGAAKMLASIQVGFYCRTASPAQNTGWPACPPVWLSGRDQWKSQVWLKACSRRDEAGHMVRRSALSPAGHGGGRLRTWELESEHCWRLCKWR